MIPMWKVVSDEVPDPTWNYEHNMPQPVYNDLAETNSQNLRNQAAEICLPNESRRIFIDLYRAFLCKKMLFLSLQPLTKFVHIQGTRTVSLCLHDYLCFDTLTIGILCPVFSC